MTAHDGANSSVYSTSPDDQFLRQRTKLPSQSRFSQQEPPTKSGLKTKGQDDSAQRREKLRAVRTRKQTSRGPIKALLERTWVPPLGLALLFVLFYATNPTDSNILHHFLFLSYRINNTNLDTSTPQYGKGPWDIAFVAFYALVLTFIRDFIMQELLQPLARAGGIKSRGKQARFTEQMYTACYTAFSGPLGLYVMKHTPGLWYFATRGMYEGFPHRTHTALFKFYYLFQAAFWVQQGVVMVLGLEKRRKDFALFLTHHVITVALISLSYRFHFTYMGVAIYVTHDISDGLLAISKSFNYMKHPLQAYSFALSIAAWIYLRHYINLKVLYSILTEFATVGPFELNWETQQYKCWISQCITFGLLAGLQALNLFWLYCLFRSAYRYVVLGIAKDDRSETEESEVD